MNGNCISDNTQLGCVSKKPVSAPKKDDELVLCVDENCDDDDDIDTVPSLSELLNILS